MPTADDLITGKTSIDDLLGISPKGKENTSIPFMGIADTALPTETDVNTLAAPIEGGGQPSPDTSAGGMMAAAIRGAGPTALSGLVGAGIGAVATRSPAGAMMAGRIMAAAPAIGDLGVGMINSMFGTNYATPTEAFQHLFTQLGVPEPQTAAEKVVQAAVRTGSESLATSGAAGIMAAGRAPGVTTNVLNAMAEDPMRTAQAAAVGGAAAEAAAQAGAPGPVQFASGMAGTLIGGGGLKLTSTPNVAERLAVQNAKRLGMEPLTSDVFPPQGMFGKFRQRVRESIPITGTAGKLVAQQESKIQAAKKILLGFGVDLDNPAIERVTEDLLKKRSNDLIRYKTMQRQSMTAADSKGIPTVPTPRAEAALHNKIQELSGSRDYAPIAQSLQELLNELKDFKNLHNVEMIREGLGNRFTKPELATYKDIGKKAINSIYDPLRKDMEDFIRQHGNKRDYLKFVTSNRRLYGMSKELELKSLKLALNKGNIEPEAAAKMLMSNKRSEVQALYNGLTPVGRSAARAAILEEAWNGMAKTNAKINPDSFVRELRKLQKQTGVFFKDQDLAVLRGFTDAVELMSRSGQFALNPPTGVVGQIPMVGGSLATIFATLIKGKEGAIGTASAILGTGALGRIFESPVIRDLLIRIPKYKVDSTEKMNAVNKFVTALRAYHSTSEEPQ